MFLGKVIGDVEADENTSAGDNSRLKIVQKLDLYRNPSGPSTVVVDIMGAGDGDIVIVGASSTGSGMAASNLPNSSTGSMIMGILDRGGTTTPAGEAVV